VFVARDRLIAKRSRNISRKGAKGAKVGGSGAPGDLSLRRGGGDAIDFTGVFVRFPKLKKLSSEYLREHAHGGVFDDPIGIELRHQVGVDKIMWSTDFSHIVTRWPSRWS
jgi:predicted TIM-barrel fold metal-dependent hydrolase